MSQRDRAVWGNEHDDVIGPLSITTAVATGTIEQQRSAAAGVAVASRGGGGGARGRARGGADRAAARAGLQRPVCRPGVAARDGARDGAQLPRPARCRSGRPRMGFRDPLRASAATPAKSLGTPGLAAAWGWPRGPGRWAACRTSRGLGDCAGMADRLAGGFDRDRCLPLAGLEGDRPRHCLGRGRLPGRRDAADAGSQAGRGERPLDGGAGDAGATWSSGVRAAWIWRSRSMRYWSEHRSTAWADRRDAWRRPRRR